MSGMDVRGGRKIEGGISAALESHGDEKGGEGDRKEERGRKRERKV
jgi:hypothetical protein